MTWGGRKPNSPKPTLIRAAPPTAASNRTGNGLHPGTNFRLSPGLTRRLPLGLTLFGLLPTGRRFFLVPAARRYGRFLDGHAFVSLGNFIGLASGQTRSVCLVRPSRRDVVTFRSSVAWCFTVKKRAIAGFPSLVSSRTPRPRLAFAHAARGRQSPPHDSCGRFAAFSRKSRCLRSSRSIKTHHLRGISRPNFGTSNQALSSRYQRSIRLAAAPGSTATEIALSGLDGAKAMGNGRPASAHGASHVARTFWRTCRRRQPSRTERA